MCHLVDNFENTDVDGAGDGTFAASHTKVFPKPLLVIDKFVHGTLPPPAILCRAGIMSAGHEGKIAVIAGVIALVTNACIFHFFIGDLEAMAGRAYESAGVATHAIARNVFKFRGVEDLREFRVDLSIIHPETERSRKSIILFFELRGGGFFRDG